jgi:hypothetical protein
VGRHRWQFRHSDAPPLASRLHEGNVLCLILSHHDGQAAHAFSADDPDFDTGFVRAVRNHRSEAAVDEVHMIEPFVAALELRSDGKLDGLKIGSEQSDVRARKARENVVR